MYRARGGRRRSLTPFVGKEVDIARVLGFVIPEGSDTKYKSKKVKEKNVGRPKNQRLVKLNK